MLNRTYTHMCWRVALVGGFAGGGVYGGFASWGLVAASSSAYRILVGHVGLLMHIMGRVLRVYAPCLLAKETASSLSIGRLFQGNFSKILRIT